MSYPVRLYVYDLSQGMAKQMSLMLTGKQLDGIWHTSVVAYGKEVFYGQGIFEATPGKTVHGIPYQVIDCGETAIDPETFQEFIAQLSESYTAERYHLITHNCNHFTQEVVEFLTGGSIPAWISGLPEEFSSTPFGQMMRPQIDAMFARGAVGAQQFATHAQNIAASYPTPPVSGAATPSTAAKVDKAEPLLEQIVKGATAPGKEEDRAPGSH